MSSLPVPVSPEMNTVESVGATLAILESETFSVFEDPDVWPDTVDYEGPNSATFARRPLARFMLPLSERWQLNFGIEQPESEVDTSIDPNATSINHAPDIGVNFARPMRPS